MEEARRRGRPPVSPCRLPEVIAGFLKEELPRPPDLDCSWLSGMVIQPLPEDATVDVSEDAPFDYLLPNGRRRIDLYGNPIMTLRLMHELQQACRQVEQDVEKGIHWDKIQKEHLLEFEVLAAMAGLKVRQVTEWGLRNGNGEGTAFYRRQMKRLGFLSGPPLEPAQVSGTKAVAIGLTSGDHGTPSYPYHETFGAVCAAALDWLKDGFKCGICGEPLDRESRKDRLYCSVNCKQWAYEHKHDP